MRIALGDTERDKGELERLEEELKETVVGIDAVLLSDNALARARQAEHVQRREAEQLRAELGESLAATPVAPPASRPCIRPSPSSRLRRAEALWSTTGSPST